MFEQSVDGCPGCQSPFNWTSARAKRELDVVCRKVFKQCIRTAQRLEQFEEHFHDMLSGQIRIELWQTIVTSDVPDWHVVKQFAALSLVETAVLLSVTES